MQETIFIGGGSEGYATPRSLKLKYANRHGLIAGATGTGKTVTLQIMAEEFSAAGVPVFLSDVKSDLAGLAKSGSADFVGSALGQALVKELSCTTGRCIIHGVLGGFSRDAE